MRNLRFLLTFCLLLLPFAANAQGNPKVVLDIEKVGKIVLELYAKDAPKTVENFLELSNKKFYDGILFHRYVEGFVIQAGDPKSKTVSGAKIRNISPEEVGQLYGLGQNGSEKNVPFEENKRTHEPGTISMALSAPHSDTGTSQFFFNLVPNHRLDNGYCVFGKIVKGMDILAKLRQGDKIKSIRPYKAEKPTKKPPVKKK